MIISEFLAFREHSRVAFPFEFCALRYLLQWQGKEAAMHISVKKALPDLNKLREALRHFQVARNFRGLEQDKKAESVRDALLEVRANGALSAEDKVESLAEAFRDKGFQCNRSASSKLLWLSLRKPFIIYDSRSVKALQKMELLGAKETGYEAFCASWRGAYKSDREAILKAVNELPKVRSFLPGATPPDIRLLALVNKPWFRERVFDIHLWELGGAETPDAMRSTKG